MKFAAAMSEHPIASHAIAEVIGQVSDALGTEDSFVEPTAAVLFVTQPFVDVLDELVATIRTALRPASFVATTAVSVIGGPREAEQVPALSLWATTALGVSAVQITAERTPQGIALGGFTPSDDQSDGTLLLLAEPFTFPVDGFLSHLAEEHPNMRVVGGLASAARGPGGNRVVCDGTIDSSGAVGLLFDAQVPIRFAVSQGCRPVGQPFTVTGSERNRITGLGGRPAVERLQELLSDATDDERRLIETGLHIGIVHDHRKLDFERGDFLIRAVMGVDPESAAVIVGDIVPIGATVQFQVRDASTASEDLAETLQHARAESALIFTCNGRGAHLFDVPNHDAAAITNSLGTDNVAGMFCAGEIGPIGESNHTHGFTASMLLFG